MKLLRWLFLVVLLTFQIGVAEAARETRGPAVTIKLREAPTGLSGATESRARLGVPGFDRVLERQGALEVRPVFTPGRDSDMAAWKRLGMDRFFTVRLPEGADVAAAAADLRRDSAVEWAGGEERMKLHAQIGATPAPSGGRSWSSQPAKGPGVPSPTPDISDATAVATDATPDITPTDTDFPKQWALRNTGSNPGGTNSLTADADMDVASAWTIETGDPSIVVAIVDTGFKLDASDLDDRLWANPDEIAANGIDDDSNGFVDDIVGYDFYYGDPSPNVFPNPYYDVHGTWVASLIGAEGNNLIGTAGVDWACKLMLLQAGDPPIGDNTLSSSSAAAAIVYAADNGAHVINLSFGGATESPELSAAVEYALSAGKLVIASMGNEASSVPQYPAAQDGVFAVGATTGTDNRSAYSSYGNWIDAVAPGDQIHGILLNELQGYALTGYATGTSASAALASGEAALLFAQNPLRTATQVADLMRDTAEDLVGGPGDTIGPDDYYGHGRLNAYSALVLGAGGQTPNVTAPTLVTGYEEQRIIVSVSASDPDIEPIDELTFHADSGSPLLSGSFTTSADKTQGTFEWWPADGEAGNYTLRFVAENSLRTVAQTTITVLDKGRPPLLSFAAPPVTTVDEGQAIQIDLAASDPDGDPIVEWAVNPGLPALPGGTLTTSPDLSSATFLWQTDLNDAGSYYAEIWAYSDSNVDPLVRLGTFAYGTLVVNDVVDQAPVVTAPATFAGTEGTLVSFPVTVSDANGEAITSLTASGLPSGATFTPAAGNASGDFAWTPGAGQAGSYPVTFNAVSGLYSLTGSATTTIEVEAPNLPPVVTAPATISSPAGITITFPVTATDPDGDAIERLFMSGLVKGMGFSTSDIGTPAPTGTFTWTPTTVQTRTVTFTAENGCGTLPCLYSGSASTTITVTAGSPTLSLLTGYSVSENGGSATITVTRGVSAVGALTVDYATVDGTAVGGTDYTPVSGTLTFPDGELGSQMFTVPILDNLVKEGNRTFTVTLSNPTGGAIINRSSAPVTIQDNDLTRGTIGLAASDFPVNENAGSVTITATRTGGSDGTASLNYVTDEFFYGEAWDGIHYIAVSGTLSWADGDAAPKSFTIPILDNSDAEGNLRFFVGAFVVTPGVTAGISEASVTILDDESAPTPVLTVSPLSHDFGSTERGTTSSQLVIVQNTGGGTLNVATPTIASGAAAGFMLSGAGPMTLAAGATANFYAVFYPEAVGAAAGSISVTSDGGSATVSLAGTGVDTTPPTVAVTNPVGGESYAAGAAVLIEWTANDWSPLQSFDLAYSTDGGATFPNAIATVGGAERSFPWTAPSLAANASAAIRVTAHDAASNSQTATSNLFTILRLDTPATIDAIAPVTVAEGASATVPVHASDAEGDAISLSATLPSFGVLSMPQSGMGDVATSITLSPGFSDAGSHSATVTEAGGASVTFGITVSNTDQGLVLTAPASLSAAERSLLTVDVTASDPDGEPVTSLTADLSGLPAGHDAAFAIVGDPLPAVAAAGRLTWTPGCDMAGSYTVTFSGTSGNVATAVTTIAVADVGTPPSIGPIADPTVAEASLLDVAVSASDAEGDAIALSATLPVFGSFVDNGGGNGTISLAPGYMHSGTYPGSVTATEGCDGSSSLSFTITVLNTDRPVTLAASASEAASEGVPFSMTVLAHDDDGEAISLSADLSALPAGNDAAFGDAAAGMLEREGTLTWTPTYDDAGSYPVTFTATAGLATATATTAIAVANTNRMPSVSAPASQSVNEGSALSIVVSAADPDGSGIPLTLSADLSGLPSGPSFADNGDNTGLFTWTPTYADASGSPYFVTFSASDGSGGTGSAVTQISVLDVATAIAFPASKSVLRLSSGKPTYCAVVEPVGGSFVLTDVDWASVRMNSTGTGTVSSIGIDATKPVVVGDQNGNMTQDATFCFGKTDLRDIFAFVSGRQTVPVTITGSLMGGATFTASMDVEVIGTGGALTASVSPNPLNPEAVLTFEIASATSVRVTLHDIQGRLVRSLANESMQAGWHDLRIDGRDEGGRTLRSGVYFYRIETGAGVKTGQLTILK